MKNSLLDFHKTQLMMIDDHSIQMDNYLVQDVLHQSLRQLLGELVSATDPDLQIEFLNRIYQWYRRRKSTLSDKVRRIEENIDPKHSPVKSSSRRKGRRTQHLGVKSPEKRLEKFQRKKVGSLATKKQLRFNDDSSDASPAVKMRVTESRDEVVSPSNLRVSPIK